MSAIVYRLVEEIAHLLPQGDFNDAEGEMIRDTTVRALAERLVEEYDWDPRERITQGVRQVVGSLPEELMNDLAAKVHERWEQSCPDDLRQQIQSLLRGLLPTRSF